MSFKPDWYSSTGNTICDILDEMQMSVLEFARAMKISQFTVNKLLTGKIQISEEIAINLSITLGASKEFWLTRDKIFLSEKERLTEIDLFFVPSGGELIPS